MAKVMIVEDEKDVVYLIKVILQRMKYEVYEAHNGIEALDLLTGKEKVMPDAIILDVMMPDMDGYTLQGKLERMPGLSKVPLIIVSGKGQMKDMFGMATNVFAFLEKPFDPVKLTNTVKDAVTSHPPF